jgi:O-Antigen ligase
VAYISLLALFFTVTNFVPVSAIGFLPIILCGWRFFGRTYPAFIRPLLIFTVFAIISTLLYDPASFLEFEFYRRDGNFFISYAPIFAGCVYVHRWDLNKVFRWFFIFAVAINMPFYAFYVAQNGLLTIFRHPSDTFGSYFVARNAAGGFLAMLFCLGIACYQHQRSRLILAFIGMTGLMLFSTYSRGSLLGVVAVLPYLWLGRKRWALGCMIGAIIVLSVGVAIQHTDKSVDYMGYLFSINNPDEKVANLDIRYEWLWPRAMAYFEQSPIVGLGFGSFDDQISHVSHYFGVFGHATGITVNHSDSHAHNSYLHFLAEMGVVGLALIVRFYWLMIAWCQEGAAAARQERSGNFIAFRFVELSAVCLLAMAATEHRLTAPADALIMALAISLLLASRVRVEYPARTMPLTARAMPAVGARRVKRT